MHAFQFHERHWSVVSDEVDICMRQTRISVQCDLVHNLCELISDFQVFCWEIFGLSNVLMDAFFAVDSLSVSVFSQNFVRFENLRVFACLPRVW